MTDNGPGIVRAQIPKIFAKLLYGSKFHRLRMSRGQQGIGISAAGMYGQLTTGTATSILSKTQGRRRRTGSRCRSIRARTSRRSSRTRSRLAAGILPTEAGRRSRQAGRVTARHLCGIEMEATYVRGRLSVDEYLKQCAIVNPHLQLHYRVAALEEGCERDGDARTKPDESEPRLAR